jgi:hypothetical protein
MGRARFASPWYVWAQPGDVASRAEAPNMRVAVAGELFDCCVKRVHRRTFQQLSNVPACCLRTTNLGVRGSNPFRARQKLNKNSDL